MSPAHRGVSRCAGVLTAWWENATADFVRLARGLPLLPSLARAIALGQDCLISCARDCVWDCRVPGQVRPLNYSQERGDQDVHIALDRKRLVAAMERWQSRVEIAHAIRGAVWGRLAATTDCPHAVALLPCRSLRTHAVGAGRACGSRMVCAIRLPPIHPSPHAPSGCYAEKAREPRVISLNDVIKSGVYGPPPRLLHQPGSPSFVAACARHPTMVACLCHVEACLRAHSKRVQTNTQCRRP